MSSTSPRCGETAQLYCAWWAWAWPRRCWSLSRCLSFNLVSSAGNRRFALACFCLLFLAMLPTSVLLGVAALTGANNGLGGFLYIFISVYLPLMSLAFTLTKESFVLEKYKSGEEWNASDYS